MHLTICCDHGIHSLRYACTNISHKDISKFSTLSRRLCPTICICEGIADNKTLLNASKMQTKSAEVFYKVVRCRTFLQVWFSGTKEKFKYKHVSRIRIIIVVDVRAIMFPLQLLLAGWLFY